MSGGTKKRRSENLYEKARRQLELGNGSKRADVNAPQGSLARDLYAGVIEEAVGDPVEGLLISTERQLSILQSALGSDEPPTTELVNDSLYDLRRRVDAARVLYLRILEEMLACAPQERPPATLVVLKPQAGRFAPQPDGGH